MSKNRLRLCDWKKKVDLELSLRELKIVNQDNRYNINIIKILSKHYYNIIEIASYDYKCIIKNKNLGDGMKKSRFRAFATRAKKWPFY